jgi:hypothetical protein
MEIEILFMGNCRFQMIVVDAKIKRDYRDDLFLESWIPMSVFASSQLTICILNLPVTSWSNSRQRESTAGSSWARVYKEIHSGRMAHEPMSSSSGLSYSADESKCGGRVP